MRCITAIWPAGPPKLLRGDPAPDGQASRSVTVQTGAGDPSGVNHGLQLLLQRLGLIPEPPGVEVPRALLHHAARHRGQPLVLLGQVRFDVILCCSS